MTTIQTFIPTRQETKLQWKIFQTFNLERRVTVIAMTIFAAICSFWMLGLFAVPAFVWGVKMLTHTETESDKFTCPARIHYISKELHKLRNIQLHHWEDHHLDEEDNLLIRSFNYISHPKWQSCDFEFDQHQEYYQVDVIARTYPQFYINKIRRGNRATLKYFASFFIEGELHFRSPIRRGDPERLKSLGWSFVHNANNGILDAWFDRARELSRGVNVH